jgi:hypothetical protein
MYLQNIGTYLQGGNIYHTTVQAVNLIPSETYSKGTVMHCELTPQLRERGMGCDGSKGHQAA